MNRPDNNEDEESVPDECEHSDRRTERTEESTSSEEAMAQSDDVDASVVDESAYSGETE